MKIELHTKRNKLECFENPDDDLLKVPAGVTATIKQLKLGGEHVDYAEYTYPEFGLAVEFSPYDPVVVELAGKRWLVTFRFGPERHEWKRPRITVEFESTDRALTPLTTARKNSRHSCLFGQPRFLQGEMFPHYKGKSASILAVIESGWGDAGNENLFLALDEHDNPCGLFHEYSCC